MAERPFLTADWRWLLMLNFEVDPGLLAPLVPEGTALDLWRGRCLASVVGFRFLDTRVGGWSIPFHRDFDEINLRFYVTRAVGDEVRRGVVFVKEVVPRRAIAWVARRVYGENYVRHPMSHEIEPTTDERPGRVSYAFRPRSRSVGAIQAFLSGAPRVPAPDEEAAFIAEHYWGYARQRDGSTVEYQVEHPPWRVWDAEEPAVFEVGDAWRTLYGDALGAFVRAEPSSAFVAEGSPVTVRRGVGL